MLTSNPQICIIKEKPIGWCGIYGACAIPKYGEFLVSGQPDPAIRFAEG